MSDKVLPWRSLIVESGEHLSLKDSHMVIQRADQEFTIPVNQIREVLLTSNRGSISLPLLTALAEQNSTVIFCDGKHYPVCELSGINSNYASAGCIIDQAAWIDKRKHAIWKQIVK